MEDASRYWCHVCSQMVNNPIMEIETIKCPVCQSGFIEEMSSSSSNEDTSSLDFGLGGSDSERALSMWAPILLGMMNNHLHRSPRIRRMGFEDENDNNHQHSMDGEMELERDLESIMRRRRRSSAAILQLLQGTRAGTLSETDHEDRDGDNVGAGERLIFMNPFNQTLIVQGSYESNNNRGVPIASLGDYFIGPGLESLLQHLAENDPNKYGTPPAQKEAIDALPTLKIEDTPFQCCVCLDECEIGTQVKEMPCKHKFHKDCILPWLELHSSCPVCRYQLPSDESKLHHSESRNNSNDGGEESNYQNAGDGEDDRNEYVNGSRFSVTLPWPFSSLFSSSSNSQSRTGDED
ncbi:hypothetical protein BUALT_Bualt02G0017600 [Buddleja alternifolia]|uniref:RING-type E3 ubiquitin transferase n=1 Tax=Buddleja alternifolia TaxID=168488 RepID=A0AAV6Y7H4_9LAMI|nr:hypothetical protein BUALT_Bualt02G0017600 [Buddleja alternifolia]